MVRAVWQPAEVEQKPEEKKPAHSALLPVVEIAVEELEWMGLLEVEG